MLIIRGGQPKVIRGTALAVPGAAVGFTDNSIQGYIHHQDRATVWMRLRNTGGNVLRAFFKREAIEDITPASYDQYITVPAAPGAAGDPAFIEGLFELIELEEGGGLYLMGEAGTTTFEAILGLRVV